MSDLRDQTQSMGVVRSSAAVFMQHVYTWMTAGLGVTAVMAYFTSTSPVLLNLFFGSTISLIVLFVAMFGLVMFLSAAMPRLSAGAATGFFLLYAAIMGIALGPTVLFYSGASITQAFVVTAGMFAGMSIFGMVTKKDLSAMGTFMFMGLIGLLLASVLNLFLKSGALDFAICMIGVIVFAGLTAWDTQKLRLMGENAPLDDSTAIRRGAILGALTLYLDFVNMFLFLLRLFGNRD